MTWKISASQIKTHATCPKSYWYSYESEKEPTKPEKGYRALGSRVHEAISGVLEVEQDFDDQMIVQARILERYQDLDQYELDEEMYEDGVDCCRSAAKVLCKKEPAIRDVEQYVEFEMDELETGVTGYIDLTTETEIWDWKTGRIRDDIDHDEKIQGSVYMAAYLVEYGEKPEKIRFVYLKPGKVRTIDPSNENWQYMEQHAKELLQSREQDDYPADPGDFCYFCDYEYYCDASETGVGGVPYEQY